MRFSIWLNALIVVALVASVGWCVRLYAPIVPVEVFAGPASLLILYVLIRILAFTLQSRSEAEAAEKRFGYMSLNPLIIWLGNAAFAWAAFVSMPYASEELQLMTAAFFMGATAIDMLLTVRTPPDHATGPIGLLLVPVSVSAVLLTDGGEFAPAIGLFYLFFAAVMYALNRAIQRLMNEAHDSRIAAEAAAEQILHERDLRNRFFASATHDLGQPLQSARLFLDQTRRATLEPQRIRAAEHASTALGAMERLVRQILDHLRLDVGAITANLQTVVAGDIIGTVASQFEPAAALSGVRLCAVTSQLNVRGDPALLERALGNLVDNAIRHADATRILIGARRTGGRVRFWVLDDGCGIDEADVAALFDDFSQGRSHGAKERGGFGLGLASVRRLAGLMGGSAGYAVNRAPGSAFFLDLPRSGALA